MEARSTEVLRISAGTRLPTRSPRLPDRRRQDPRRRSILDADFAAIRPRRHGHVLAMLGTFPAREMVVQWLKAGVVEQGRLHRTEEGLLEAVLSALAVERRAARDGAGRWVRYRTTGTDAGQTVAGSPVVIRYPDDLVALSIRGTRRSRSRRGLPVRWRPGASPSTRTRRMSSPSMRALTLRGSTSTGITAGC